jgi:hypothetical protein
MPGTRDAGVTAAVSAGAVAELGGLIEDVGISTVWRASTVGVSVDSCSIGSPSEVVFVDVAEDSVARLLSPKVASTSQADKRTSDKNKKLMIVKQLKSERSISWGTYYSRLL